MANLNRRGSQSLKVKCQISRKFLLEIDWHGICLQAPLENYRNGALYVAEHYIHLDQ